MLITVTAALFIVGGGGISTDVAAEIATWNCEACGWNVPGYQETDLG